MEFIITIGIILIYAIMQTLIFKKRVEQTIPTSIFEIILIVYFAGIFDRLDIGMTIVKILAIVQLAVIIYMIAKKASDKTLKEVTDRIFTPGLLVYIGLCILVIIVNKGRIFGAYDEFTHWGRIIKNMFLYNTYGTNAESVVTFNEYPPLTAIFQYLFVSIKRIYSEETVLTAQNILYFSMIIPITKNIKWDKSFKNLILMLPVIIILPMVFFENFYLDILVDGILGIMLATVVYYAFEEEDDLNFKYLKISSGLVMLCLTKTSGITLAILALAIIIIRLLIHRRDKKVDTKGELLRILVIILLIITVTVVWNKKADNSEKRWDFSQYVRLDEERVEDIKTIGKKFVIATFTNQVITSKNITAFVAFLILVLTNICVQKKADNKDNKNYKYYSRAMLVSIIIYMISLLITYAAIFDGYEGSKLACFDRYNSTIFIAVAMFQIFALFDLGVDLNAKNLLITFTAIMCLSPQTLIFEKYVDSANYKLTAKLDRDIHTKLRNYKSFTTNDDSVLYIAGTSIDGQFLISINQYEIMPTKIADAISGAFESKEEFINVLKQGKYTHVFIYRMKDETKEKIKDLFQDSYIRENILYKVTNENGEIFLERVHW